jgi:hypothetical protein
MVSESQKNISPLLQRGLAEESPGIGVGVSCRETDVIRFLEEAIKEHGQPAVIKGGQWSRVCLKGARFMGIQSRIKLDFHDQGSPPTMRL